MQFLCATRIFQRRLFIFAPKQAKVLLGQDKQATASPLGPSRGLTSVKRVAHSQAMSASPLFIQFRTKPTFHSIEPQQKEIALRLIRMRCAYVLIDMHARRFHVHLPLPIFPPCMGYSLMGRSRQLGLVSCQCELCWGKKSWIESEIMDSGMRGESKDNLALIYNALVSKDCFQNCATFDWCEKYDFHAKIRFLKWETQFYLYARNFQIDIFFLPPPLFF